MILTKKQSKLHSKKINDKINDKFNAGRNKVTKMLKYEENYQIIRVIH